MGRERKARQFNWFLLLLVIIGGWFSYMFITQQIQFNALARDQAATRLRLEAAQARNALLKKEQAALYDPAYIEKVARETLGMTRHGEVPYISARQ
ncbi:MAG: FtsB family cell division protein [Schwartzia sp. (in: firmicutes)]